MPDDRVNSYCSVPDEQGRFGIFGVQRMLTTMTFEAF